MFQLTFYMQLCALRSRRFNFIFFFLSLLLFPLVLNSFVEDATILCLCGYFSILCRHLGSMRTCCFPSIFSFPLWFPIHSPELDFTKMIFFFTACWSSSLSVAFHFVVFLCVFVCLLLIHVFLMHREEPQNE